MELLLLPFLGTPVWMWATFLLIVIALLAFDLGILNKEDREIGVHESLQLSSLYIALGLAFGGFVWWQAGSTAAAEYWTAFVVEKSLALDNIFVIALIFSFFSIPRAYQHRVLFWGILGVIVLRALMIGFGAAIVSSYAWVLYVFAAFLILTGVKMLFTAEKEHDLSTNPALRFIRRHFRVAERLEGSAFFVRVTNASGTASWIMTPLFLALIMVELADVVFAVDSIPAVFAITTDPFIVYTSNIFAILGLRALYFALAAILHRFAYLKQALAVLLVFIGGKVFAADLLGIGKFPPALSLGVTFAILGAGVGWSLWKTRGAAASEIAKG